MTTGCLLLTVGRANAPVEADCCPRAPNVDG